MSQGCYKDVTEVIWTVVTKIVVTWLQWFYSDLELADVVQLLVDSLELPRNHPLVLHSGSYGVT
jgi:hypothetical protein